ncbi:MAG: Gfo/Idh/MocA family oxidoreductase [Candidatus Bipolaricaulia bacterium]
MRVAIFGAGGWGKNHVRTFCSILGEDAVVVCDPDPAQLQAARAAHTGIETCDRPRFEGVDAVVIAAPAVLHYELAKDALNDGFHVLVEKPITLTSDEAEELARLAEERERILMVDHLLEYHPAVVRLKELVDEGRLGRILHLTSRRLNLGVIRSEENALWSLAPHDVSVILRLLDEEPIEVAAHGACFLQDGIPDVVHATLRFPSGALAHVHVSWQDPIKVRDLTVVGEERMAVFDDVAEEKLTLFDARARRADSGFVPHREGASVVDLAPGEPLRRVAEAFIDSVKTGRPPIADARDGLRVVRVLEAAQRSMDAGGTVVRIGGSE